MSQNEVLRAADANMLAAWRAVVSASPAPGVVERAGTHLLSTGAPVSLFNPAFAFAPPDDPDAALGEVTEHYASLGVPFALYFRDDVAPGLAAACKRAGLVEHWQPPVMVLDPIPPTEPAPADLDIRSIGEAELEDYAATIAAGFGMPLEFCTLVANEKLLASGYTALLASLAGKAVATSGVFVDDGTAGVYSVATRPEHRRRGLGAAITWAAVYAGAAAGATRAILQSSAEGEPVYRRMGFTVADRYRQFEAASAAT